MVRLPRPENILIHAVVTEQQNRGEARQLTGFWEKKGSLDGGEWITRIKKGVGKDMTGDEQKVVVDAMKKSDDISESSPRDLGWALEIKST
ncbi:hypothetical protein E2P81_ATG09877 [Venturia nashicola]|uniref:Uncharacterized protein n=1 Tax=Venturia nashicola TaxID=86259 RepID=A0A4Z1NC72_9PEZI|nr:hypothetical protein E6O75_ATG10094 [Venturia nashicola]TLD15029.1 hypothetical protein E2P81_ATG09877 [Venturia nashicola]